MDSIKSYFFKKSEKKKGEVLYSVNPINIKIVKKGYIDPKDIEISYNGRKNEIDNKDLILVDV